MLKGIHLMDQGNRRYEIEQWHQRIDRLAANRVLAMDVGTMCTWERFDAKHQLVGRNHSSPPSLWPTT